MGTRCKTLSFRARHLGKHMFYNGSREIASKTLCFGMFPGRLVSKTLCFTIFPERLVSKTLCFTIFPEIFVSNTVYFATFPEMQLYYFTNFANLSLGWSCLQLILTVDGVACSSSNGGDTCRPFPRREMGTSMSSDGAE